MSSQFCTFKIITLQSTQIQISVGGSLNVMDTRRTNERKSLCLRFYLCCWNIRRIESNLCGSEDPEQYSVNYSVEWAR